MLEFVHLRVRSEYSLVDSIVRIKSYIARCAELGMPAAAITDHCNLFATVKFYKAARSKGIKPIIGADFLLAGSGQDRDTQFSLLAKDDQGYKNIMALISRAYLDGQEAGYPRVQKDWLSDHASGLICLSGAVYGELGQILLRDQHTVAADKLSWWMEQFPGRFFIELQRTGRAQEDDYIERAVHLASQHQCPIVATNDVRFIESSEFDAHEARVCIHDGNTLGDSSRPKRYSSEQYLRSAEDMSALFSDLPEALANTVVIAQSCNLELTLGEYSLPEYPIPDGETEAGYLRRISHEGLDERLAQLDKMAAASASPINEQDRADYRARLDFELDIIIQMEFPGYFLIVMDFIKWAKAQKIPVGPGRGSGAGSLVAYALEITDLDPIEYDLLFERFLNPERVSMPDFDIDFCMDNRDQVIGYVAERYGRDAVSQIVTFGTMAAKAVVRDVARVQGKSYGLADRLSKMIPFEVGMTLSKALSQEEVLRDFLEQDEEAREIWEMAEQLEGVVRNCGKHAGGVVIAPTRLVDFSPLYCDETGDGLVTQYDKDDVESVGLVKFDFLGLRTLTIIDWAVKMVNDRRAQSDMQELDINQIDLEDHRVFELLQKAQTTAVFQLESRGMKDLIKRLLPSCFEDIVALVALFRPGPLQSGMVDDFINRKHGREQLAYPHPKYQHEELKPVLEPTYGIILYQEQVMQIAQIIGDFSLGGADLLRRAMGKKKPEEMAKQREIFQKGARGRDIDDDLSSNLFDLMEKFAGYGFNKSHSAAYALVAYQTAWLKTHHPAEFMAAVMSADMQNTDKIVTFVDECHEMGIDITAPDVNTSAYSFTVNQAGDIVYGLGAIKGLGEGAIESIVEGQPYTDLFDFCIRTDLKKLNKRSLEALICGGAFDCIAPPLADLGKSRAYLTAVLPEAIKTAEQHHNNQSAGIDDLFGSVSSVDTQSSSGYPKHVRYFPWSNREVLQKEKDCLGLYLNGHPIDDYAEEMYQLSGSRLSDLKASRSLQSIAGLVVGIRNIKTKRGDSMAIVTLDDRRGRMDVTLFGDLLQSSRALLVPDAILVMQAKIEHDDYTGGLRARAEKVESLYQLRKQRPTILTLAVDEVSNTSVIAKLKVIMEPYLGGNCQLNVAVQQPHYRACFQLGDGWQVEPSDELMHGLRQIEGVNSVALAYRSVVETTQVH